MHAIAIADGFASIGQMRFRITTVGGGYFNNNEDGEMINLFCNGRQRLLEGPYIVLPTHTFENMFNTDILYITALKWLQLRLPTCSKMIANMMFDRTYN